MRERAARVTTTIVFPAQNNSPFVGAATRSYYAELLIARVVIQEFVGGLLHTKTLTVDGEVSPIGSANMDRRRFDLNFENNILVYDADLTKAICGRQDAYIAASDRITVDQVNAWP